MTVTRTLGVRRLSRGTQGAPALADQPRCHGPPTALSYPPRMGPSAWSAVGSAGVGDRALAQVALELALDPLQGVVDRLHVALQALGDLLVALALDVQAKDLG